MNIKELAEKAGMVFSNEWVEWGATDIQLERFAELIRQDERGACAKECWTQMGLMPTQAWSVNPYEQCILSIMARGEK
jgi:hypothetical protein